MDGQLYVSVAIVIDRLQLQLRGEERPAREEAMSVIGRQTRRHRVRHVRGRRRVVRNQRRQHSGSGRQLRPLHDGSPEAAVLERAAQVHQIAFRPSCRRRCVVHSTHRVGRYNASNLFLFARWRYEAHNINHANQCTTARYLQ